MNRPKQVRELFRFHEDCGSVVNVYSTEYINTMSVQSTVTKPTCKYCKYFGEINNIEFLTK